MSNMMLNLDAQLAEKLQRQADLHGVPIEVEIHKILQAALSPSTDTANWLDSIRKKAMSFDGLELDLPKREHIPETTGFIE
ncbi:hypothetical protein [Acinetobacter sp.]|uniref:hypothetical protein n=1 Tax=Acinetobacter sp. TaxID=472 RepID=UPI002FDB1E12